jgi:DedD protein
MARPISDEELQLKKRARRRLVGAIVLVTAVAVVLPMVLDSEPRPVSQNIDIQIPSPDSGEFKPRGSAPGATGSIKSPQNSGATSAAAPTAAKRDESQAPIAGLPPEPASTPRASAKAAPKAPEAKAAAADSGKDAAKSEAKEPAIAKEPASTAAGAYVVQVAALADAGKARQLEKQMAAAGLKTYTEVVNTQSGEVTRVRAGPFATRESAEKARSQLKKAGMDGTVLAK